MNATTANKTAEAESRALAGAAHRWRLEGPEEAICDIAGDRRFRLFPSQGDSSSWLFVSDDTGEIIDELRAESMTGAIGVAVSRVLAARPKRVESAERMMREGLKPRRRGGIGLVFDVPSETAEGVFYKVIPAAQLCNCPDFRFRKRKCKHLLLAERTEALA